MAERRPLVLVNSKLQELPIEDTLPGGGGGGGTDEMAKKYWRLKGVTAGAYDGGALALYKFFDEDNVRVYGFPYAGSEAFGGTASTAFYGDGTIGFWAGAAGAVATGTSWVAVEFASPVQIDRFSIISRSATDQEQMWDAWDLECSDDGITWQTVESYSDAAAWGANEERSYDRTLAPNKVTPEYLGVNRTTSAFSNVTLGAVSGRKCVIAVTGQADNIISGLTIEGLTATLIEARHIGNYDFISFFEIDGLVGDGSTAYSLSVYGENRHYRHTIAVYAINEACEYDWVFGTSLNADNVLTAPVESGDAAIVIGTISGSGLTASGGAFTVDSASTNVATTFYSAVFSKQVTATEDLTITIDEGGVDDRTFAGMLVIRRNKGTDFITTEESKRLKQMFPLTQKSLNAATYSTINDDFIGNRFIKVRQTCTVIVEPNMKFKQPVTFIPTTGGMITFAAGTGVTLVSPDNLLSTRVLGSAVQLVEDEENPNTFFLMGDLA